jgi:hypothetical protein
MRLARLASGLVSVEGLAGALLPDQGTHPSGELSPLAGLVVSCLVGPSITHLFGERLREVASGGLALALLLTRCRQILAGDACTLTPFLHGALAALVLAIACAPAPTSRAPNAGERSGVLKP